MASGPGPVLAGYPAAVAGALARVLGPALVGVYLHGSADQPPRAAEPCR